MTLDEGVDVEAAAQPPRRTSSAGTVRSRAFLRWARWVALLVWALALTVQIAKNGIPFDREGLLLWLILGLAAATLGRRAAWTVLVDWLPFVAVLVAYDYARGAADSFGMPTWWTPQLAVDKFLFGGTEPTVWLQAHLKYPGVHWWDVASSLTYISFFFLPYVVAGVLWLRSRTEFHRWAGRFVTLSFLGFGLFALIPASPPWAAARCLSFQVKNHPYFPGCMRVNPGLVPHGGLLGQMTDARPGSFAWVERISGKGFPALHLTVAKSLLQKGQQTVDLVAAVPSLHAGGTMLFAIFLWRRSRWWWRAVLVAYQLLMAFALVYSGEHYVSDILAGWFCAALVHVVFTGVERRRSARRPPDRLAVPRFAD